MRVGRVVARVIPMATAAVAIAVCPNGAPPNSLDNATGQPAYWASGSQIRVYIDTTSFPQGEEQTDIRNAFSSWQTALPGANVSYTFEYFSGGLPPADHPTNYVVVQRGVTTNPDGVGENGYVIQNNRVVYAYITISDGVAAGYLNRVMIHEIGHNYGLGNCAGCSDTAMYIPISDTAPTAPTDCDRQNVYDVAGWQDPQNYCSGSPGFVCSSGFPTCVNGTFTCTNGATKCWLPPPNPQYFCGGGWALVCSIGGWSCQCNPGSCGVFCPLVVDTLDEGFHLTDWVRGVPFSFWPQSPRLQLSWTDSAFGNGFIALDRNANGAIDDGTELFGNITPQPYSGEPNGFEALAVFDRPESGGNGNGVIDGGDSIYSRLRVWVDTNHNGVSEPTELKSLLEIGIAQLDLKYHHTPRIDQFGNEFRYRGSLVEVVPGRKRDAVYDVFLVGKPE